MSLLVGEFERSVAMIAGDDAAVTGHSQYVLIGVRFMTTALQYLLVRESEAAHG